MILLDSGPMIALLNPDDTYHAACSEVMANLADGLGLPSVTIGEISYFLARDGLLAAESRLLRMVARGDIKVLDPVAADYARAADLVEQYADFPLGTVDALIVAMAERLAVTTVFTLDRRHFGAVRPLHVPTFDIVP